MSETADPILYTIPTVELEKLKALLDHLGTGYDSEAAQADRSGAPLAAVRWLLARLVELEVEVARLDEGRSALIRRVDMLEVVATAALP